MHRAKNKAASDCFSLPRAGLRAVWLGLLLMAAACGEDVTPVDPSRIPPISGREKALLISADAALHRGETAVAERDYLAAAAASEGQVIAHLSLMDLYRKQQRTEDVRAILARARGLQPNHPSIAYLYGKQLLEEGNYVAARQAFTAALAFHPQHPDLLTGAGIASDMVGDHRGAQALHARALAASGKQAPKTLAANLAMSHLLANEPQKAVALLTPHARSANAPAVLRHNLALAYGLLGKDARAQALLRPPERAGHRAALERMRDYHAGKLAVPPRTP